MPSPRRLVPPLLVLAALCRGAPAAFSSAASAQAPPGLRRATSTATSTASANSSATSTASANSALRLPRGGDLPMAAAAAAPPGRLSLVPTGAAVVEACGRIAPAASVLLSLSPLPTIRGIVRAGTVGDLPLLPYSSLVANAFVWFTYGILKRDPRIWSCNACSVLLGLYYSTAYASRSPSSSATLPGTLRGHFRTVAAAILLALGTATLLPPSRSLPVLGGAGVTICVGLFASPLAAMGAVIRSRSARSIPLPFALASVANCTAWLVVGWWGMADVNVWLPNGLGLAFGLVQVGLRLRYGDGRDGTAKQAA